MSKFKHGDTVRVKRDAMERERNSFIPKMKSTLGAFGVVEDTYDTTCVVAFPDGQSWYYKYSELEVPDSAPYIINGANYEYPTLEAAEAGVKAIGNNGVTYDIAQIVKRVTVKRETVVTLEETV
jgi:hypothetical protein